VATVGIGNGANAGLLAVRILSIKHPELEKKLQDYTKKLKEMVSKMNEDLKNML
jgi:5-(carboxyamino)imidazole ribonucleotide mutase